MAFLLEINLNEKKFFRMIYWCCLTKNIIKIFEPKMFNINFLLVPCSFSKTPNNIIQINFCHFLFLRCSDMLESRGWRRRKSSRKFCLYLDYNTEKYKCYTIIIIISLAFFNVCLRQHFIWIYARKNKICCFFVCYLCLWEKSHNWFSLKNNF